MITVPIALRRRGVEAKLVIADPGKTQGQPDPQLCRLVARARHQALDHVLLHHQHHQNMDDLGAHRRVAEAPAGAADRLGRSAPFALLLRLNLRHPRGQGVPMVWTPK